ncbi:hypothetical protein Acor_05740 [Acrocarpospora corrugata]|uniref:5-guanidino-2-oxopentanoate decarboxylase n=1 Tax=Acrocarpospora corrugata TaxID=35763 RepID=A0A5M3VTU6_9ACTN|nr:thiamine pyrophosphate-binding protein [Acrocarpospora corrugata]GER98512.1 hypothetical protein Acor_05740 [Acrocarpospora corrugata]
MTTAAQALALTLTAHGVDTVFGIPGTHNLAIYQALTEAGVHCVTTRHEQGAGYAADGYARATGRPGVVLTTTGPAVLNAATALAQAYSDSSPILLISPGVPLAHPRLGRGYLHEAKDQSRALDSLCAWSHRVTSPGELPAALARAFTAFTEGRPRPIHLEIPVDLLDLPTDVPPASPLTVPPRAPDPAAVTSAATLLGTARRPAIVLGGGVHHSRAGTLALTLAERLGAPIVTTANGKAAVPESHPLALGATLHLPSVQTWLAGRDVVLAVGTELAPSDLWADDFRLTGRLIRIDVDPAQMHGDHPATIPIVADATSALDALLAQVTARPTPPERPPLEPDLARLASRWAPELKAIRDALPADAIVAADNSMFCYYGALGALPIDPPGRFLYPTGFGTLGFALPAAIGAKVARPDTPVAVLAGDGAFQFSVQELATAVELGLPIPIVISVNGGYGEIRAEMLARGMAPVAVDLHTPDFAAVADAYGACGVAVDTPEQLSEAVGKALRASGPTVIVLREAR